MFIVSTLAAVVASQALISASFSIIRQSIALGCFPRVTMVHTSEKHEGQIYSPEVNYFLMIACILITVGFKGGAEIGNAFGKKHPFTISHIFSLNFLLCHSSLNKY
jgi:KUP system potassium uptake protein